MSRRIIWVRHAALIEEEINKSSTQKVLVEKLEGKGELRRHSRILDDNIKVNLKEMER
jgi:hypothetical protein